jgi:hypothetical protein
MVLKGQVVAAHPSPPPTIVKQHAWGLAASVDLATDQQRSRGCCCAFTATNPPVQAALLAQLQC